MGENGKNDKSLRFDEFELDLARRRLLRFDEAVPLKPKAFDLLAVLVENNGRLLTKDDLFQLVWADQFVDETNLTVGISAIRRALGEKAAEPRFITNVSGRGYYFSAEIKNGVEPNSENRGETLPSPSNLTKSNTEQAAGKPSIWAGPQRWIVGSLAAVLVLSAAVLAYFYFPRPSGNASVVPGAFSVKRLTTTGRTPTTSVSPDGKMFVFSQVEPDRKSSLWLSQIDGSGSLQLRPPSDKAIASTYFAPDNSRVYFIQFETTLTAQGTLYRMPVIGGVPEKLKEGMPSRIALSPDGREIAWVRTNATAAATTIMISSLDGPAERELETRLDVEGAFTPIIDWSPDGQQLAVAAYVTDKIPGPIEVLTVNIAGGKVEQVSGEGWYAIKSIAWMRDGKGLLASVGEKTSDLERQVWYLPLGEGKPRPLLADSNSYGSIDISADGSVIVAAQGQSISNVWVAPANDLAAAKQLTFDMFGKQSGWNSVDWSSDGQIIYSGRIGKSDTIWQMNADGGGQRQLIPEGGRTEYSSLPDDGKFVVFMSNRSGQSEIWRANRDGTDVRQLTFSGDNESPNVSPDSKWIVFNSGRNAERRLWRIAADGGEPVRLTDAPSDWARYSPDSSQIACQYDIDGKGKLAIIGADGGKPLKIFDVPETANFRLGVRWTPDGKAVTYRDWQYGIWKQSVDGGSPVRLAGLPEEKLFAYAWSRDGKWFAYSRGSAISDAVLMTSLQ